MLQRATCTNISVQDNKNYAVFNAYYFQITFGSSHYNFALQSQVPRILQLTKAQKGQHSRKSGFLLKNTREVKKTRKYGLKGEHWLTQR